MPRHVRGLGIFLIINKRARAGYKLDETCPVRDRRGGSFPGNDRAHRDGASRGRHSLIYRRPRIKRPLIRKIFVSATRKVPS